MMMDRERKSNGRLGVGGDFYQVDRMESKFLPLSLSSSSTLSPPHPSLPISSSSPSSSPGGGGSIGVGGVGAGLNYIEHTVSKMDTLAGVAIKYGVEVADIKRMNNLVTDLQMFALKTLQIPLPGRHPPSPILSNGFDAQGASCSHQTPLPRRHSDLFGSFQSLKLKSSSPQQRVSSAMSTLQGYYGLKPTDQRDASDGCEMAVYRQGAAHYLEDGPFAKAFPRPISPLGLHRKCKSVANGFMSENGEVADILAGDTKEGDSDKWSEKLVRRRQKSEADFTARTPELLLEDNSSGGGLPSRTGKGLALRQKAASRTAFGADAEASWVNPIPIGLGDSIVADNSSGVRKSSSTPSLQEQESSISSIWPTSKWSLKEDLQALSSAAITLPIFDGLPKPITGRRNKTALD